MKFCFFSWFFLLPLISVVGPFGDLGFDGGYVPGRARLSPYNRSSPRRPLSFGPFALEGGGSFVGLGRCPVEAFLYRLGGVSLAERGPLWCPATPRDGVIPRRVVQMGGTVGVLLYGMTGHDVGGEVTIK